ncbi:serine--tRNA ligase [Candidatus Woesebacteria bacterium]|nr:serine--tRNA ligase [Candidatus Woesebacteria bacterium]
MLDMQYVRDNAAIVKQATLDKGFDASVIDELLEVDAKHRVLIGQVENIRRERNVLNDSLKKNRTDELIAQSRKLKAELDSKEPELEKLESQVRELALKIPNPSAADVLVGKEEDNQVVRQVGTIKKFDFPVRDHLELGTLTKTLDLPAGTKVAQSGFYYVKGLGAMLEFALAQFALSKLAKHGFTPVITPNVANEHSVVGCGFQARSDKERQIYHLEGEDLDMIGTAEITLVGQHQDETFNVSDLPLKYAGYSYCYRYEKGSYGRDVRGIIRVHEFRKIEMVVFCLPEESDAIHEKLREIEEEIWTELEVPYQLIKMATGDLGNAATRKYDIEAWMPSQNKYREVTSTSNTTDFQARRLGIKVRRNGATEYLHTLNGTAFALGRAMVAIYENYQNEDGSITVPTALQPFVGATVIPVKK